MVVNVFSSLKLKIDFKPKVDNIVFRLHYRYTYLFFMVCVILTTLYDWIGKSIDCLVNVDDLKDVIDSWCFIMGTFTVDKHHDATKLHETVPYPGIGPHDPDDEITVHSYYQWVPFVLFFQGVLFYVPHWIWKGWEGGLFKSIIMDLSIKDYLGNNLDNYEKRSLRYEQLAIYIKDHLNTHSFWAVKFFVCESLNLIVSVTTFIFTDWFLGGEFKTYGTEVFQQLKKDPEDRQDPMYMVFPRMAKCTFRIYGPSGTKEKHDAMCLIATNIVNEKIYIFIWLWLIVLMSLTAAWLVIRIFTILLPQMRAFMLKRKASRAHNYEIKIVMDKCNISDWFLLFNLAKNMDKSVFSEFISLLAKELQKSKQEEDEYLNIPMSRMSLIPNATQVDMRSSAAYPDIPQVQLREAQRNTLNEEE